MELNREQYEKIQECFPKQRKPAKISNLEVLNAVLYIVENGCKWRRLPKEYGDWHVIYVRVNRWAKKGVLQKAFLHLQQLGIIQIQVNIVSLDSTCIKVHPDGMGALKKAGPSLSGGHAGDGTPSFIWLPQRSFPFASALKKVLHPNRRPGRPDLHWNDWFNQSDQHLPAG